MKQFEQILLFMLDYVFDKNAQVDTILEPCLRTNKNIF
jgi:hypothetical protein